MLRSPKKDTRIITGNNCSDRTELASVVREDRSHLNGHSAEEEEEEEDTNVFYGLLSFIII